MPAIDEQSRILSESRIESLIENNAAIGPEWRKMLDGMREQASELAVEAVQLAAVRDPDAGQVQTLSERLDALGERVGGVGLPDMGTELKQVAAAIASASPNALTNASARALETAHGLDQVAELSKDYDLSREVPIGEATTLAQAPSVELGTSEYGGFAKGWPQGGLVAGALGVFDAIDGMRQQNGMSSLRDTAAGFLFKDFTEVLSDLRESIHADVPSGVAGLEAQLGALGAAQQELSQAQGDLQTALSRGDEFGIELAQEKVLRAEAAFTAAEAGVMGSLETVGAQLGVALERQATEVSEGTLVEFLEAGGQVNGSHVRETQQLDDLAGLTVRELGAVGDGPLSLEDSKDVAAMLDSLANRAEANGLAEAAANLRDAAAATLEGADAVDFVAVQDYVSEVKDLTAGLRASTEEFGVQLGGEFTRDESIQESVIGAVEGPEAASDARFGELTHERATEQSAAQEMDMGQEMAMKL